MTAWDDAVLHALAQCSAVQCSTMSKHGDKSNNHAVAVTTCVTQLHVHVATYGCCL